MLVASRALLNYAGDVLRITLVRSTKLQSLAQAVTVSGLVPDWTPDRPDLERSWSAAPPPSLASLRESNADSWRLYWPLSLRVGTGGIGPEYSAERIEGAGISGIRGPYMRLRELWNLLQ